MELNLCQNDHESIAYVGYDCPLCEAKEKIADLKIDLGEANDDYAKLEDSITSM